MMNVDALILHLSNNLLGFVSCMCDTIQMRFDHSDLISKDFYIQFSIQIWISLLILFYSDIKMPRLKFTNLHHIDRKQSLDHVSPPVGQ